MVGLSMVVMTRILRLLISGMEQQEIGNGMIQML